MGTVNLSDIQRVPMARIPTAGGDVMHAMKQSDTGYCGFGEAYFSWISAGSIKAWKRHMRMTMNLVAPVGLVRFVFCVDGQFREEEIGETQYARLTVPPGVWFGFYGLSEPQSLVLNIANIGHDPTEVERLTLSDIEYVWT